MTIEEKLLLIKAGYTKSEIEGMEAPKESPKESPKETPKEAPKPQSVTLTWEQLTELINGAGKPETPAETPTETPKETPKSETPQAMTTEQYSQLLQAINRGNANIDLPKNETSDALLNRFYNYLGAEKKEEK